MNISIRKTIPPKDDFYKFNAENEKIDFLKSIGLLSKKAEEMKPLFYKGAFADEYCICELIGYKSKSTLVISLDSHLHCINTDCFIEIQPLVKEFELYINNYPVYCEA